MSEKLVLNNEAFHELAVAVDNLNTKMRAVTEQQSALIARIKELESRTVAKYSHTIENRQIADRHGWVVIWADGTMDATLRPSEEFAKWYARCVAGATVARATLTIDHSSKKEIPE